MFLGQHLLSPRGTHTGTVCTALRKRDLGGLDGQGIHGCRVAGAPPRSGGMASEWAARPLNFLPNEEARPEARGSSQHRAPSCHPFKGCL